MSDVRLPQDVTAIEAAAQFDEALAQGQVPAGAATHLDPDLAELIRCLHEQLGPRSLSNTSASRPDEPQYGRFRLIRRLGAGTYGVIHLAHDPVLKRDVALKIPRAHVLESDDLRRRLVREAQAAAQLKHPHIVQVLQADVEGNNAYIATEYCAGPNLDQWLRQRKTPVPPHLAAEIVANLADALGCAHESGILHRDVKPGNVLLAEVPADDGDVPGQVRLTDFGLARWLEQEAGTATADGALMGTFAYMAPEQVDRSHGDVGRETDVHALGALLYELLTCKKPFGGQKHSEILLQVCHQNPRSPRQLAADVPRDLEAICLKCLEKSPERRYRDGNELCADLRRFLAGETTVARPLSFTEQGVRTIRRHPWGAALASGVLLGSLLIAAAVAYHNRQLETLLNTANAHLRLANERQAVVTDMLYVADMRNALNAYHSGDPATVRRQLDRYRTQPAVRGIEWSILDRQLCDPELVVETSGGPLYSCAVSPVGTLVATASQDGVIRLWDLETRQLAGELRGHERDVNDLAFNSDGTRLISAGEDRTARIWNVPARTLIRTLEHSDGVVYGVAFSPDGQWIATGGKGKSLRLWNAAGETVEVLATLDADIEHLQFSPDGAILAAASGMAVHLWSMANRAAVRLLTVEEPYVAKVSFSPDGRLIAGVGQDRRVYLWDVATGERLAAWNGHRDSIHDVEFTPDGSGVVSCGRDETVRFWPVSAASDGIIQDTVVLESRAGRVWSVALSNDGATLMTAGEDGGLRIWETNRVRMAPEFGRAPQSVKSLDFSPDGARLATARSDETIAIWNVSRREIESVLGPAEQPLVAPTRWSPDGRTIATGLDDGAIQLWSADGSVPPRRLAGHGRSVLGVCFSPTGSEMLYSCSYDGTVRSWDLTQGHEAHRERLKVGEPLTIAVSPDGERLACDDGHDLVIWQLPSWAEVVRMSERCGRPDSMEFSRDGRWIVTAHGNHQIQLWDPESNAAPAELTGHEGKTSGVVFSRDGRTITSVATDGTVRLWHVPTRQEIGVLRRGTGRLTCVRMSADGRWLAAGYAAEGAQSGLLMWEAE